MAVLGEFLCDFSVVVLVPLVQCRGAIQLCVTYTRVMKDRLTEFHQVILIRS